MLIEKPLEKNLCHKCYYKFVTNTFRCRKNNNRPCVEILTCDNIHTKRFTQRLEDQNGNPTQTVIFTPELRYSIFHNNEDEILKEVLKKLAYYEEMEEEIIKNF